METIPKRLIKKGIAYILFKSRIWKKLHSSHVVVLCYHRILPQASICKSIIEPAIYVTQDTFDRHMSFLSLNYEIISFDDYINRNLSPLNRYCIITFDDGWRDNYLYAYPILKKYAVPATIFLTYEFINTNKIFWTDRIARILDHAQKINFLPSEGILNRLFTSFYNAKSIREKREMFHNIITSLKLLPPDVLSGFIEQMENILEIKEDGKRYFLSWDEIIEMSLNNLYFGSHGMSHRALIGLSDVECRHEIEKSMFLLKEKRINFLPVFSYPYGDYNGKIKQLLKGAGYKASVTTESGLNRLYDQDFFAIRRFNVHEDISKNYPLLCFHISGIR